jgi:hypothetical protein
MNRINLFRSLHRHFCSIQSGTRSSGACAESAGKPRQVSVHLKIFLAYHFLQGHTSLMISAYRIGDPRALMALRVFLRLTAMDVCCGPPSLR